MKRLVCVLISSISMMAMTQTLPARPPQFVMMAFDGSLNLNFWQSSRDFAKKMNTDGKPFHFTYFISAPYFLSDGISHQYIAPHHGAGHSAIGFGGSVNNIAPRVAQMNMAYEEGNEIASHACSHYDGGAEHWSLTDWKLEFTQFWHYIFDALSVNKVQALASFPSSGYVFDKSVVVGFRAPMLGTDQAMYATLHDNGFQYDTSQDDEPTYWPAKSALGIWNFPLADLVIAGTGKRTLSMDYNFYIAQSGGREDRAHYDLYRQQMVDTYLKYFQNNYNGNRAPINIGHHFSPFNGGAYWEAMQEVAQKVCGMSEVRCVTYSTYMKWLNSLDAQTLASYRAGKFQKSSPVQLTNVPTLAAIDLHVIQNSEGHFEAHFATGEPASYSVEMNVNGKTYSGTQISSAIVHENIDEGSTAAITARVLDENGNEIARATQNLENINTENEKLSEHRFEDRAMIGDPAEAHEIGY